MRRAKTPIATRGGASPASQVGDDTPRSGSSSPAPPTARSVRSVRSVHSVRSTRSLRTAPSSPLLRGAARRGTGPQLKKKGKPGGRAPPPLYRSHSAASGLHTKSVSRMKGRRARSPSPLHVEATPPQTDTTEGSNGADPGADTPGSGNAGAGAAGTTSGTVPDTPVSPDGKDRATQRKREHRLGLMPPAVDTSSPPDRRPSTLFASPRADGATTGDTTGTAAAGTPKPETPTGPSWRLKPPKPGANYTVHAVCGPRPTCRH